MRLLLVNSNKRMRASRELLPSRPALTPSRSLHSMLKATHTLSLSAVMRKAWGIARHGAKRFGGSPRLYLAAAPRQAW